jgi:hypothetical protein
VREAYQNFSKLNQISFLSFSKQLTFLPNIRTRIIFKTETVANYSNPAPEHSWLSIFFTHCCPLGAKHHSPVNFDGALKAKKNY